MKKTKKAEAITVTPSTEQEVRLIVDTYYQLQKVRVATGNQESAIARGVDAPSHESPVIAQTKAGLEAVEKEIVKYLDYWRESQPTYPWMRRVYGIGPVLSAGLMAYVDLRKANHPSAIWKYAGLVPFARRERGKKSEWNAQLKLLCYKIGDCFVKFSGRSECFGGSLYRKKKAFYVSKNEAGGFAETCKREIDSGRFSKGTDAYRSYLAGRLPDGRVDLMARRYAVKLFLSAYWQVGRQALGLPTHNPWVEEHGGHADIIRPEQWVTREES